MNRSLILFLLIFMSCTEFDVPYEDVNGIYLQWIAAYECYGNKMVINNKKCYLKHDIMLEIYDMPRPYQFYSAGTYYSSETINDFEVLDTYAYCALNNYGLEIIDCQAHPPDVVGRLQISNGANVIRLYAPYAFLAQNSILYIIDISDKTAPEIIGNYTFTHNIKCMETYSSYACITLVNSDFYLLDMSDPINPMVLHYDTLDQIETFTLKDQFIYFLRLNHIEIYEITEQGLVEFVSLLECPDNLSVVSIEEKYGVVFSYTTLYLLNCEYPSYTCVQEWTSMVHLPTYCVIHGNYIYTLIPYLNVIEIKKIPE